MARSRDAGCYQRSIRWTEAWVLTRTLEEVTAAGDLRWFAPALDHLRSTPGTEFLAADVPVMIARAPGRLDVMGGIADYSGSLVLEMPLARATFATAQPQSSARLDIVSLRDGKPSEFSVELGDLLTGALQTPDALAAWFAERPAGRWAAYVVGSVYECLTLSGVTQPPHGLRLFITSDVPEGKGVSSSAALEVAVMSAAAACYGVTVSAAEVAAACQWAENHIARAPCGIMDQMTSALGRRDRLLRLRCQPATVEGHVGVPAGYRFYGIDSGIRHAVTGSDYTTVRTAAFMGYRIIAELTGLSVRAKRSQRIHVADERWRGYLANIAPDEFSTRFADWLPARMRGADFLAQYGGITDTVTRVLPDVWYPIRQATWHPVFECDRVTRFGELLATGLDQPDAAETMGALMLHSHTSYGACGLGSDGTDRLVDLVMEAGPARGLFGAKITGGGSGGTVAILGTDAARGAVHHIAREYERETGRSATVFDESGPGADEVGVLSFRA
jgi:L-arabinokinase